MKFKFGLFAIALTLVSLFGLGQAATQSICAAPGIEFGTNYCTTYNPKDCPYGSQIFATNSSVQHCVNPKNRFCELMTGTTRVLHTGASTTPNNNFAYCATPVQKSTREALLGTCKQVSGPNYNFEFFPVISPTNPQRREIEKVFEDLLGKNGGQNYFANPESSSAPGGNFVQIECNEVNSQGEVYITIPKVGGLDNYTEPVKTREAADLGLTITRGNAGTAFVNNMSFCNQSEDAFITEPSGKYCVSGISTNGSMRPCVTKPGGSCVLGLNSNYFAQNSPALYSIDGVGNNLFSLADLVGTADPRCQRTARDVLRSKSNAGCTELATYDPITNTLSSNPNWESCVKCLYGDSPVIDTTRHEKNGRDVPNGKCDDLEANPCPTNGDPVTVDNEPFAQPIAGRLWTEVGCVGADGPAGVVNTLIRIALGLMGGIVIFRIIQGATTMQQGSPEAYEEGRSIITSAILGLLVLIFSAAILNFLGVNILNLQGFQTFGP
jgi:hypothetical protein